MLYCEDAHSRFLKLYGKLYPPPPQIKTLQVYTIHEEDMYFTQNCYFQRKVTGLQVCVAIPLHGYTLLLVDYVEESQKY